MNDKKDAIFLVTRICDVAHAHNDTTQCTMAIVLSDVKLYTIFMSSIDDTNDFYRNFLAVVETINIHSRSAGYHPQLCANHFESLCGERDIDPTNVLKKVATNKAKEDEKK